jgi:thiol:disulfide interchange protein DsbC
VKKILSVLCVCLSLFSCESFAAPTEGVSAAEKQNITRALEKVSKITGKKITPDNIQKSSIPGLYEVISDVNVFYISADGKYLISGDLLDLSKDQKSWNMTEKAARSIRKKILAAEDPKNMIIFAAKEPKIGSVTVFTDIDCHYCRQLQSNIKDYTDLGIEVRYMAFPRTGIGSPSYDKAVTVWCSDNKQRDLTLAKQGKDLPKVVCADNPVKEEFELGRKLGVSGTPTIFLENGVKLGGLLGAKELAKVIKEEGK